jgi:hypothetical protein
MLELTCICTTCTSIFYIFHTDIKCMPAFVMLYVVSMCRPSNDVDTVHLGQVAVISCLSMAEWASHVTLPA